MSDNLPATLHERMGLTREQLDLVRRTVAADCNDDELELFLHTAHRYGLDPLVGEIHAIKRQRWDNRSKGYVDQLTIQVGIDGYRALADRTGCYCPGPAAEFEVRELGDKRDLCCTFTVLKLVPTGLGATKEWRPVQAVAWFSEYVQLTKDGKPNRIWRERPKGQLEKCAETLALRRAFPREVGGLRTHEEMAQADNVAVEEEAVRVRAGSPAITWQVLHDQAQKGPVDAPRTMREESREMAQEPTAQEAAGRAQKVEPMAEHRGDTYMATEQQRQRLRAILVSKHDGRKLFTPDELAKLVEALGTCADSEAYDKLLDAACDEADQRRLGWKDQPTDTPTRGVRDATGGDDGGAAQAARQVGEAGS